jgi:DNA polymerase I-like protein with 3'-5' exonuclease and polymerase domains
MRCPSIDCGPRLQNLIPKTKEVERLRKAYAATLNPALVCMDYSALEVRMLALYEKESK